MKQEKTPMKTYNNGQRKGMMYGGATKRKPMMYGGMATKKKPRKKAYGGGMMTTTQKQQNMMQNQAMQQPMMKMAGGGETAFGMLSVKAGVDNNPKPTLADKIVGAKKSKKD